MLRTSTLPDELAHGYLGRIRAINLLSSSEKAASALLDSYLTKDALPDKARRVASLAAAANLSLQTFCQHHTFIPFLRTASNIGPGIPHGSSTQLPLIESLAFRLLLPDAMACRQCIAEDLEFWGFSYWRRRHQLPGVVWCDKHHEPLFEADKGFDHCPSVAENPADGRGDRFGDVLGDTLVTRYIEIATGLLDCRQPVSYHQAANKLSQRAQALGIRVAQTGQRENLSDIALQLAPRKWLSFLLPGIESKKPGEYCPLLDKVVRHYGLPQCRALALALLFDSSDDALRYWNLPVSDADTVPVNVTVRGQDYWNGKQVFNAYVNSGGNRKEIGRILSVNAWEVTSKMDRSGLPSLTGLDFETTGRALEAYFGGMSLTEACTLHAADSTECDLFIRQAGARFGEALRRVLIRSKKMRGGAPNTAWAKQKRPSRKPSGGTSLGDFSDPDQAVAAAA